MKGECGSCRGVLSEHIHSHRDPVRTTWGPLFYREEQPFAVQRDCIILGHRTCERLIEHLHLDSRVHPLHRAHLLPMETGKGEIKAGNRVPG